MSSNGKIGEGHMSAMARQGLRELRGSLYTGSNIAQQPEYGLYGTMTPGEIADARRDQPALSMEEEGTKSPLQESMQESKGVTQEKGAKEIGLER